MEVALAGRRCGSDITLSWGKTHNRISVLKLLVKGVQHSKGAESIATTELKKQSADERAGSLGISTGGDEGLMMDRWGAQMSAEHGHICNV